MSHEGIEKAVDRRRLFLRELNNKGDRYAPTKLAKPIYNSVSKVFDLLNVWGSNGTIGYKKEGRKNQVKLTKRGKRALEKMEECLDFPGVREILR